MSTTPSSRVSSRLADKRQQVGRRSWRDDDFEYTPISSFIKEEKEFRDEKYQKKSSKVVMITQSMADEFSANHVPSSPSLRTKKRGRPPKSKPPKDTVIEAAENETPMISDLTESEQNQIHVEKSSSIKQMITCDSSAASTSSAVDLNVTTQSESDKASRDVLNDMVQGLMTKPESPADQIFPVAAAVLPAEIVAAVSKKRLKEVTMEIGVLLQTTNDDVTMVLGSPGELLETSKILSNMVKDTKGILSMNNECSPSDQPQSESTAELQTTNNSSEKSQIPLTDPTPKSEDETLMNISECANLQSKEGGTMISKDGTPDMLQIGDTIMSETIISDQIIKYQDVHKNVNNIAKTIQVYPFFTESKDGVETQYRQVENLDIEMIQVTQEATENLTEADSDVTEASYIEETQLKLPNTAQSSYVSNRQGAKRRQGKCRHHKETCDICCVYCQFCQYRSTEISVRKHMQRVHPTHTYDCEVCGMKFGIRYDMRRHRMVHFDEAGNLTMQAKSVLRKADKNNLLGLKLMELEDNFKAKSIKAKNKNMEISAETKTSEEMLSTVGYTVACQNSTSESPTVPKGESHQNVWCVFCKYIGSLDTMDIHHKSRHMVPDANNMEYVCPVCKNGFSLDMLRQHYFEACGKDAGDEKDLDSAVARCKMCRSSGNSKSIKAHIECHPLRVRCCECNFTSAKCVMELHLKGCPKKTEKTPAQVRNPPKESSVLYKCGVCSNIFKTRASLQMHFKSHEVNTIFRCMLCSFEATRRGKFNAHMRKMHSALKDRQCQDCNKVFTHASSLHFHRESVHGIGRTAHKCEHCKKVFSTKRFLQVHTKRIHEAEKRFVCSVCDKKFFERARMLEHQNVHLAPAEKEARKHVCSFCGKSYSHKGILRQHENVHLGLRPYSCDQCNKSFAFTAELHKHKKSHSSHRPHICLHCGKGFKFPYKLTAHMVTHTKQGHHFCSLCDKVYTSLSSLRKHQCRTSANSLLNRHFCTSCDQLFTSIGALRRHNCEGQTGQLLIITGDGLEEPALVIHTADGEEEMESKDNVMEILGDAIHSDINTSDSQVVKLTNESLQTIVKGEQSMDTGVDLNDGKSGFEDGDGAQSSVLYMCCVCNHLFTDQEKINSHMVDEHGAEAVISQTEEIANVINEEDISEVMNFDNVSDVIHADNVSDVIHADNVSDVIHADNVSDVIHADNVSDVIHADNVSDVIHADNVSDVIHADNVSDVIHADNVSDVIHADNVSDVIHDDNVSDVIHADNVSHVIIDNHILDDTHDDEVKLIIQEDSVSAELHENISHVMHAHQISNAAQSNEVSNAIFIDHIADVENAENVEASDHLSDTEIVTVVDASDELTRTDAATLDESMAGLRTVSEGVNSVPILDG